MTRLPIHDIRQELLDAARECPRLVVRAPTGSGKSTQIPQMLLDGGLLGDGQVVVLQPRRLAARLLAARVARERACRLGAEVGFQIRFENVCGRDTRIRYVTEGVLMRQMLDDPSLRGVSTVIFDEFHERHLYGDVSLGRALDLQAKERPDLRILVMSATLRAEALEKYLTPCRVLTSEGRTYPVDIEYLPRPVEEREGVWTAAAAAFERLVADGLDGDVLVFMPGAYEIQRTIGAIRDSAASRGYAVLPLHGDLPPEAQDEAVAPSGGRPKVIVSTNVAETSITIEGVRAIIDSGLARIPRFDAGRGINMLLIERISRASADQRAGRAGRTAPGRCIRLWTDRDHAGRAVEELPEIRRVDLAEIALTLKASGTTDLRTFRWLDPPEPRSLDRAETLLRDLGATDDSGAITDTGRRMLAFPVHPRYARMLIEAGARDAVAPVALIAALVQGRDILFPRAGKDAEERRDDLFGDRAESDFFRRMRAFTYAGRCGGDLGRCSKAGIRVQGVREVAALRDQFVRIARAEGLPVNETAPDDDAIQKCILAGFIDHLAARVDEGTLRCRLVHGRAGMLARESAVRHARLLVAAEVREIEGRDLEVILSLATEVKPEWLREMFPADFNDRIETRYDKGARRVTAERQVRFRDLPLETKPCDPDPEAAADLLAAEVLRGDIALPLWNETVDQWLWRVAATARHMPELGIPAFTDDERRAAIRAICAGAVSARDLKDRPVMAAVKGRLEPRLLGLVEKHAPERVELRNGKRARITYAAQGVPSIAMKIQDLYGVTESPRILGGRVALAVQILGPNQRPVQVTQDLAGFWKTTYPKVKQELARKYPKHEWR